MRKNDNLILASSQWLDGKLQGKSVKFNQLVQNGNFTDVSVWSPGRCSYSVNSNTATIVPNAIHSSFRQAITITNNHKIFYCFDIKYTLGETYIPNFFNIQTVRTGTGNWEHIETIITPTNTNGSINIYDYDNDIRSTWYLKNVMVIDLTTLFGAGNEPTTLAEFYATDLGKIIKSGKYLNYGSGILNATAPFVFKDANDNTLATYSRTSKVDLGSLNWGYNSESGHERFYTTDLASIMKKPQTNNDTANCYCPIYKTLSANLGYAYGTSLISLFVYNTGRLEISNSNYTDAQSFKSAMSGIYLEYEPATQLELKSAGTIKDTLSNCDGKTVRKIGSVDLGTLDWSYRSQGPNFYTSVQNYIKKPTNDYTIANIVCSKYTPDTARHIQGQTSPQTDKTIGVNIDPQIVICDTSYTDATAFKNSLNGVILNYELATYTTETKGTLAILKLATKCTDANGMEIDIERNN